MTPVSQRKARTPSVWRGSIAGNSVAGHLPVRGERSLVTGEHASLPISHRLYLPRAWAD